MVSIIHCLVCWLTEPSGPGVQEANMLLGALNQPVSGTVADQVMGDRKRSCRERVLVAV